MYNYSIFNALASKRYIKFLYISLFVIVLQFKYNNLNCFIYLHHKSKSLKTIVKQFISFHSIVSEKWTVKSNIYIIAHFL